MKLDLFLTFSIGSTLTLATQSMAPATQEGKSMSLFWTFSTAVIDHSGGQSMQNVKVLGKSYKWAAGSAGGSVNICDKSTWRGNSDVAGDQEIQYESPKFPSISVDMDVEGKKTTCTSSTDGGEYLLSPACPGVPNKFACFMEPGFKQLKGMSDDDRKSFRNGYLVNSCVAGEANPGAANPGKEVIQYVRVGYCTW